MLVAFCWFASLACCQDSSVVLLDQPTRFVYITRATDELTGEHSGLGFHSADYSRDGSFQLTWIEVTGKVRSLVSDEMYFSLSQGEIVRRGNEAILVSREVDFEGPCPQNESELNRLRDQYLSRSPLQVLFYDASHIEECDDGRFQSLSPFFGDETAAFQKGKPEVDLSKLDSFERTPTRISGVATQGNLRNHYTFQPSDRGWRIQAIERVFETDKVAYAPDEFAELLSKGKVRSIESVSGRTLIKMEMDSVNTIVWASESKLLMSDGSTRHSSKTFQASLIAYDEDVECELRTKIPEGTTVNLVGAPQIKAQWHNGKVVRVYDQGFVDDLSKSIFFKRRNDATLTSWYVLLGMVALCAFLFWRWIRGSMYAKSD